MQLLWLISTHDPSIHLSLGIRIREVLDDVGSAHGDSSSDAVSGRRRPWELRSVIQEAFKASVEKRCKTEHPEPWLSRLQDVGIRDSMEGAIETRLEKSVPTATAIKRMMVIIVPLW